MSNEQRYPELFIRFKLVDDVIEAGKDQFVDQFVDQLITDVLEPHNLLGAGCLYEEFSIMREDVSGVTLVDFELIREWSRHQNIVVSCELIQPEEEKIQDTAEAWENGTLGCDERFARKHILTDEENEAINCALGLEEVTLRLETEVIDEFKRLAQNKEVGYKTLMRVALKALATTGNFTL